jgi:hypothetical protein
MARRNDYHLSSFYNQITKTKPLLYDYQFIVEFVQGGTYTVNDGVAKSIQQFQLFNADPNQPDQNFSYYAQSASLPKFSVNKANAKFYGIDFRVPTVIKYEHQWQCEILLEQDMIMYEKLRTWAKLLSDLRLNGGGIKTIPDVSLRVSLLNAEHTQFTTSFVLAGVWLTEIPEIKLEYKDNDTAPLKVTPKFQYQYCYRDDKFDLTADPLSAKNNKLI